MMTTAPWRLQTRQSGLREEAGLRRPAETLGYCELFSTDWWLVSGALLMLILVLAVGSAPLVGFLACVGALIWRNPGLAARSLVRYSPILLLPAFALASTSWSDAPDVTLKQGLEFLLFVACCIVLVRRISGADLAGALLGPTLLVCAACLILQPSALHGVPLRGFLASKNIFAFLAQLLVAAAISVALDKRMPLYIRGAGLFSILLGCLEIALAQSAGAYITTAFYLVVFMVFRVAAAFTIQVRIGVVVATLVACMPLALVFRSIETQAQSFQQNVLHKESTLTGRTGLWRFSESLTAERPLLGHGFSAFWRQGNLDAEGLWRTMGIASRTGFNFHNQFIDVRVDFGLVGLTLFCMAVIWIGVASVTRAIISPTASTVFLTAVLLGLYSRLPVESALIGSWSVVTLLWLAAAIHALSPQLEQDPALQGHAQQRQFWRGRARPRLAAPRYSLGR